MSRPPTVTSSDVALRLQASGPLAALDLAAKLGVHRSQITRQLAKLGDGVVQLGRGPRSGYRYALRRRLRTIGDRFPLYRIGPDGRARQWATLNMLHGGFQLVWSAESPAWAGRLADADGFLEGLPCFLGDLRPQGFLGRLTARGIASTLGVDPNPEQWSDDDTLAYLQAAAHDGPGNLLVGEGPLRVFQNQRLEGVIERDAIPAARRAARYAKLAASAIAGDAPGSSAGGEQPKFAVTLAEGGGYHPVLVKFSPVNDGAAANRRWTDLLTAEHHALAVLSSQGLADSRARLLESAGRVFLEVRRHDRDGAHGRIGQISLTALHAGLADGAARDWFGAADDLLRSGLIDARTRRDMRRLAIFGGLIGNNDMHFGNLSFYLDDALPLRLTPTYDMLPMLWRPGAQGEIAARELTLTPPLPADIDDGWNDVARWAMDFWQRVADDARIAPDFRQIAQQSRAAVGRLITLFGAA